MNWYLQVLNNYTRFDGRARRTEFWMFALFNIIFSAAASVLDLMLGTYCVFSGLYGLFVLVPSIAVAIRRLQDTGKSGLWLLLIFVPLVQLYLIVLWATDGTRGDNRYGPDPKA